MDFYKTKISLYVYKDKADFPILNVTWDRPFVASITNKVASDRFWTM